MNDKLRKARAADNAATRVTPRETFKLKTPISRDGESRNGGHKARRIIRKGK